MREEDAGGREAGAHSTPTTTKLFAMNAGTDLVEKRKKVNDALQSCTVNRSCFGLTHRELASSPHTLIWPRTTAVP